MADLYTLEDAELDIANLRGQVDQLTEILKMADSQADWGTPASGSWLYSLAGHLKFASADGNAYQTGTLIQQVSPRSQTINTTGAATIGGLSASVEANATYLVHAVIVLEWNAAAGQPELRLAGPAVSQYDLQHASRQSGSASTANTASEALAAAGNGTGYNTAFYNPTAVMTGAGIFFTEEVWFWATFTASGTLTFQAATTVAADPWIVFSGIWAVSPV